MFEKIKNLTDRQVAVLMACTGLAVFFSGLRNPFQGDDSYQIVNNPPVHSITHIIQLFGSGTFYNGQTLSGNYYRPLMSTVFSVIYTIFGAHTVAFHIVQLSIYISSAFILYLVFKHFLNALLALPLALIFLVHPLNSQVVYSIPTMQDALFFLFGILAIWLLITYKSEKSLWAVAACLLLALLSKESGVVFTAVAILYIFWFDRKRLRAFIETMVLPIILYTVLRINAVGINHAQRAAPVDGAHLLGRLLTAPSIMLFYITKFIFPWKLASAYYWVYPKFSVRHVLLPIIIDIATIGLLVYLGMRVRNKLKAKFKTYLFFAAWTAIGIVLSFQVIPLDMTVCETWFYFPMAGLLGMIGVAMLTIKIRFKPEWLLLLAAVLIGVLGIRSALRGADYHNQYTLAKHDIVVSPGDYSALNNISQYLIDHGQYKDAAVYAQRSIALYPVVSNYNNLGVAREQLGDYVGAAHAYSHALKYNNLSIVNENLSLILMVYSDPTTASQFFQKSLTTYPHDFKLWLYFGVFEGAIGSNANAKIAISNAAKYGSVPPVIYNNIMNDQPFPFPLLGKTFVVR